MIVSNAVNKDITPSEILLHLPTTSGEHCTGGAATMREAIGAQTIDPELVQVHKTDLEKPADPEPKIRFLAAEAHHC